MFGAGPRFRSIFFASLSFAAACGVPAFAQVPSLKDAIGRVVETLGGSDVTLDNVSLNLGSAIYRMPKIEFAGVTLSRTELMALFDRGATEGLAPRLARLTAKQVKIPELVIEQQIDNNRQVTRYRNIVLGELVKGKISSGSSESGGFEGKGSHGAAVGTMGRLTVSDVDLPEAARIYEERGGTQPAEMKRLYGSFSMDNLVIAADAGAQIKIARIAGRDFFARPTKLSWAETMKAIGSPENTDKLSPAEQARVLGALGEIADATQIGLMEATAIEIADPKSKDDVTVRIARLSYTSGAGGRRSELRTEALDLVTKKGKARIGIISFSGFSFASTFKELGALGDKPLKDVDISTLRKLIPTIGTIRFSGLDFDVPNEKSTDPDPENIKFTLKDLEVTADKPVNGIPTNLLLGVEGFRFVIPPASREDGLKDLVAMGYQALDLSWLTALAWNESSSEIVVREISIRGADMGSMRLRGALGGVTKDVFNSDTALALVALLGATVKNADFTLENGGLFEKLMAQEARKQGKSVDDLRREFGVAAAVAVPVMLGNSGAAKSIGQAVARFVAKPGKLSISARTKDPGGLGVADFTTLSDPSAVLDKLEVTAVAE